MKRNLLFITLLLAVCAMIFSCNKLGSSDYKNNQPDTEKGAFIPSLGGETSIDAFNNVSMEIVSKIHERVRNNPMLIHREDLKLETIDEQKGFLRSLGITESDINNFNYVVEIFIRENGITSETSPEDIFKILESSTDYDIIPYAGNCDEYKRKADKIMRDFQIDAAGCVLAGMAGGPVGFGICFTISCCKLASDSLELDRSYPECSGMRVE
ncbi:hypothetical protein [Porphyromonas cangingivalis]|uniref:hypothetical protein n=1 Tax=Porphyromonas cangingivalis TaxID=36874 RepID=UPI00051CC7B9|nr:hypothetical protein [Porphyromonas cangingivalis]KGL50241.1 hypothetical protein HQ34_00990 [Porphyromonas cangingivalis]